MNTYRSHGAARIIESKFPQLEKSILLIYGVIFKDEMLIQKAKLFGVQLNISDLELKYSKGWIHNFKRRHNIREMTLCGESRSVNKINASKSSKSFIRL